MARHLLPAFVLAAALGCAPAPPEGQGPPLWSISDADSTVWLFGSVHVLRPNLVWRSARLDAALAEAEIVVFEADVGAEAATAYQALAAQRGAYPPGQTLPAALNADQRAALARAAQKVGLDARQFETVRPWLAALQLSAAAYARQGAVQSAGVETVLAARARADGARIAHLETVEQQVGFLADLSERDQIDFLLETIEAVNAGAAAATALDEAWARGDVRRLARGLDAEFDAMPPALRAAVLTDRNARWTDEIIAMLAGEDDVLVAVGAAHLVGEENVIDMLRARGLAVEGP
ncbi:MAG: TraB/GumN family protein [Hyphomonadaceae bacterium]|nr:TraB/GumN family protein [Hyphomonadaceae bacterium]